MSLISLGNVDKKILIPIIGGLLSLIYNFFVKLNSEYEILSKNPFILSVYSAIGMIMSFIPFLILKSQIKKQIKNKENYIDSNKLKKTKLFIKYEHYDIYKVKRWDKYKLIIIATLFDFTDTLLNFIFCYNCIYNLWVFDILFNSLFSYLILKAKLYKHQYISMIIIIILGCGLNVIEFFKSEGNNTIKPIEIIVKFIDEMFFCLNTVINKYNMETYFSSPYEICLCEGLIELVLFIIVLIVFIKIGVTIEDIKYPDNYKTYINNFNKYDLLIVISAVFINFIYNISILITCNYFTPCHVLIILIISECYYYLKSDDKIILNILGIIILSLIFFMFLFFIEVLEINSFGISLNTKRNISIRADSDLTLNFTQNDMSLDYEETEIEEDKNNSLLEITSINSKDKNKGIAD